MHISCANRNSNITLNWLLSQQACDIWKSHLQLARPSRECSYSCGLLQILRFAHLCPGFLQLLKIAVDTTLVTIAAFHNLCTNGWIGTCHPTMHLQSRKGLNRWKKCLNTCCEYLNHWTHPAQHSMHRNGGLLKFARQNQVIGSLISVNLFLFRHRDAYLTLEA